MAFYKDIWLWWCFQISKTSIFAWDLKSFSLFIEKHFGQLYRNVIHYSLWSNIGINNFAIFAADVAVIMFAFL